MRQILSFLLLAAAAGLACAADLPKPETDAARVLRLVAALEASPFGDEAQGSRRWLLQWLQATPDYSVMVCEILGPVPGGDVPNGPELMVQQMFGNVAYQIQNPDKKDQLSLQVAGVESTLRAYAVIVGKQPASHIAYFDELLKAQQNGSLRARMTPVIAEKCRKD